MTPLMWLIMALRRAVPDRAEYQPGCWEYQARVWPRTCLPFWVAQLKTRSALVKLNWFWLGSVASIFISFSGVTMLNSRLAMVVYAPSPRWAVLMAVPKYRLLCAAAAPSVLSAASAGICVDSAAVM